MCKQVVTAVCVVMVISASAISKAEDSLIEICVGVSGTQIRPAIDGDLVTWQDGLNIGWLRLSDPNLIRHTIVLAGTQEIPDVSGDVIVWLDRRISDDRDLYAYDVVEEAYLPLPTADGIHQRGPKISGEYIVCEHYNSDGSIINAAVFNFETGQYELIAPNAPLQTTLAIDGSIVVWRDDRNGKKQIYRCDLSVTPYVASPVDPDGGDRQWRPAVSGNIVVWEDLTSADEVTLKAYDTNLEDVVWTHTMPYVDNLKFTANMSVSEGIIVWQERQVINDYNIRGYDLNADAWLDIATGIQSDENPVISGRTVVWQRNGTDIVGTVIPEPDLRALAVTSPLGGEQVLADKDELLIAWEMLEGDLPDDVTIEVSSDAGESWDIVEAPVPADAPYLWSPVADVHSQQCQIRVSIFGVESIHAVSEMFTIFQCDTALTADLTGDCFVDMADVAELAAQWLTCGNPFDDTWCVE